jgi:hypothetical protein
MGNTPSYFLGQFQPSPVPLPSARMTSGILSQLPILQLKDFPLFVHNCEHLSSGEFDLDVFMPRGGHITILDGIIFLAQTVIEEDMGGKYTIERLRLSAEQMQWLKDRQGTVYESSMYKIKLFLPRSNHITRSS